MEHNATAALAVTALLLLSGCLNFGGGGGGIGSNLNPQAVVTVASGQKVVELGSTVRLDASESIDEDGTITAYRWDFGDGDTGTSSMENHKYFYSGEFIVSLSETDDKGAVGNNDRRLTYVTVLHPEVAESSGTPHAIISVRASVVVPGTEIELNGAGSWSWVDSAASTDDITSWSWEFSDGGTATGDVVTHKFGFSGGLTGSSSVGNHLVKLTVVNSNGELDTVYHTIRVIPQEVSSAKSPDPDVLTIISIGDPVSLDPAEAYDTASGAVLTNTYETLVFYDRSRTDKLIPILAEEVPTVQNGLVSPDGLNYTFERGLPYPVADPGVPEGIEILAMSPAVLFEYEHEGPGYRYYVRDSDLHGLAELGPDDYATNRRAYQYGSGMVTAMKRGDGEVLCAGSCEWVMGLTRRDPFTETITRNALEKDRTEIVGVFARAGGEGKIIIPRAPWRFRRPCP